MGVGGLDIEKGLTEYNLDAARARPQEGAAQPSARLRMSASPSSPAGNDPQPAALDWMVPARRALHRRAYFLRRLILILASAPFGREHSNVPSA